MTKAIARFLEATGYPDRPDGDGPSCRLLVDGADVLCEERDGNVVLSCDLGVRPFADGAAGGAAATPETLARFAAGRILKEDAVLSWDAKRGVFLWQEAPADAPDGTLLRFFETFMDSCEWWRERAGAEGARQSGATAERETAVILP